MKLKIHIDEWDDKVNNVYAFSLIVPLSQNNKLITHILQEAKMTEPIEFETKRLYLRQWTEGDFIPFAKMNSDSQVMTHFPDCLTTEESLSLAKGIQTDINTRGWGLWAVEVKDTTPFIGFVGLNIPSANLPFSPCVEISWQLYADFWGKGYAPEAAQGVLAIAFEKLQLEEIVSFTAQINQRSRNVMERIGMKYNGTFDHPRLQKGDRLRKHVLYRLSGRQWHQTNSSKSVVSLSVSG